MDQDNENSTEVIKLLLNHGADTNVICSGHSPLTLAIYSGNDTGNFACFLVLINHSSNFWNSVASENTFVLKTQFLNPFLRTFDSKKFS